MSSISATNRLRIYFETSTETLAASVCSFQRDLFSLFCTEAKQSHKSSDISHFNICHFSTPISPDFLILFNFADTLHLRVGIQTSCNLPLFVPRYVFTAYLVFIKLALNCVRMETAGTSAENIETG